MKSLFLVLSLLSLVSCGKKSSDSAPRKETKALTAVNLSNEKFSQSTPNGMSYLQFDEKESGTLRVFLGGGFSHLPLDEKNENAIDTTFKFEKYKQVSENEFELTNVSIQNLLVRGCRECNTDLSLRFLKEEIHRHSYYDLLEKKEGSIRVHLYKEHGKNYFVLLNIGGNEM